MKNWAKVMLPLLAVLALGVTVFAAEPVKLTFAYRTWDIDYPRFLNWYIPTFEKLMAAKGTPVDIEVVELPAPDDPYRESLVLRLAAGTAPDIFMLDTFYISADAIAGYLLDLTDMLAAWPDWAFWTPAAKGAITFQGKVWGLNRHVDVRPLYYRKDIFKLAGLPVPWQPKSWEDLLEAARTINAKRAEIAKALGVADIIPIAIKAGSLSGEATTMQGFYMLLLGAGGRLYDAASGKWVAKSSALLDTLKFYHKIYIEEKLSVDPEFWMAGAPIDTIHPYLSNAGQRPQDPALAIFPTWDGVWYDCAPGGKWELPERDERLGYCKMPAKEPGAGIRGQDFVTISGGWAMVINAKCKHPELAFEFLKFVCSKGEVLAHRIEYPGPVRLPTRSDITQDPAFKKLATPYDNWCATELVPLTTFRPGLPAYPKVSDLVQEATDKILLGEDPEDVLEWYAKALTALVGADNVIELP
jgi:multiple sugar transport system substrate-binding protein